MSSSSDSALPGESIGGNLNYPYRTEPPPNVRQSIFSNGGDVPTNFPSPSASSDLFDPVRPRYPSAKYLPHLAGLFFDHLACHFPFLDRTEVMEAVENETLPAVMANSIAALACRFSNMPDILKGGKRYVAGEPFADMSKVRNASPGKYERDIFTLIAPRPLASHRPNALLAIPRGPPGPHSDCMVGIRQWER